MAAFWGTLIGVGKMIASIAQAPARLRQGGNVRVDASYALSLYSKLNITLTSVALVARPCAPDAQRAEALPTPEADLPKVMAASRPWF